MIQAESKGNEPQRLMIAHYELIMAGKTTDSEWLESYNRAVSLIN